MKRLLSALLAAALLTTPAFAQAPTPTPYLLLSNASTSGPNVTPNGGAYLLSISGTFGGTTIAVVATGPNGATQTLGSYTSAPAYPTCLAVPVGVTVRATVTGGSPSGLYALLGGTGEGQCPAASSGGATAANQQTQITAEQAIQAAVGAVDDAAVTNPASDASVIAALKGILTNTGGTPSGTQDTNLVEIDGNAVSAGAGAVGTGTARVAVGQDATTIAGSAPGTAGSPSTNVVSIQGVGSGTAVPVSAASLPLPSGAATSALQTSVGDTAHTDADTINTTLGSPMQQTGGTVGLVAGSAIVGKVGIDQTTPGTTNGVQVNAALPAGSNIIGNVRIDQTTPGTTNGVVVNTPVGVKGTDGSTIASAANPVPVSSAPGARTLVTLDVKTVTTGGTAVTALSAGHRTAGGFIMNPLSATINLCINEIGTATGTTSSGDTTCIAPGQSYALAAAAGAVSVISSDSSHPFSGYGLQ